MERHLAPGTRARRLLVALGVYLVCTGVFFATTTRQVIFQHTPYNHFALLAEGWLEGRLDLGGPPPNYAGNNDFAQHGGRYYVSFPPLPAVLLLPAVYVAGSVERVRDGQVFLWLAGAGPAVLFIALEKLRRTGRSTRGEGTHAALALLFALGTVYWFTAVQGTVWFAAHVVAVLFASLYLLFALSAERPFLAGLCLGLALAARTPLAFAFPLFLFEALRASRRDDLDPPPLGGMTMLGAWNLRALATRCALFALPVIVVLAVLFWHNRARFGDPMEFGHGLLTVGWRGRIDKWGLFSYHYLGRNLAVVLTNLPYLRVEGVLFQINVHGLPLWLTTPVYAWALWPRRTRAPHGGLVATVLCVAAPSLLYQNSGWIQFGYRFSNDFAPFLFALLAVGGRRFGPAFWGAAALGVAVNAFGATTFQRAGWERYYYQDASQRVIHQPD